MTKTIVISDERLGDFAFNVMDYLLDRAEYNPGQIVLHHGRDLVFCYDLKQLKFELSRIATNVCRNRYKRVPKDLEEIVLNALEEFSADIAKSTRMACAS